MPVNDAALIGRQGKNSPMAVFGSRIRALSASATGPRKFESCHSDWLQPVHEGFIRVNTGCFNGSDHTPMKKRVLAALFFIGIIRYVNAGCWAWYAMQQQQDLYFPCQIPWYRLCSENHWCLLWSRQMEYYMRHFMTMTRYCIFGLQYNIVIHHKYIINFNVHSGYLLFQADNRFHLSTSFP